MIGGYDTTRSTDPTGSRDSRLAYPGSNIQHVMSRSNFSQLHQAIADVLCPSLNGFPPLPPPGGDGVPLSALSILVLHWIE
jgi:hypothetical protein